MASSKPKTMTLEELREFVDKKVKTFTKQIESAGKKCGIILNVRVAIQEEATKLDT